jgi:hypothetical protein
VVLRAGLADNGSRLLRQAANEVATAGRTAKTRLLLEATILAEVGA